MINFTNKFQQLGALRNPENLEFNSTNPKEN
jgi:hypothetical protein